MIGREKQGSQPTKPHRWSKGVMGGQEFVTWPKKRLKSYHGYQARTSRNGRTYSCFETSVILPSSQTKQQLEWSCMYRSTPDEIAGEMSSDMILPSNLVVKSYLFKSLEYWRFDIEELSYSAEVSDCKRAAWRVFMHRVITHNPFLQQQSTSRLLWRFKASVVSRTAFNLICGDLWMKFCWIWTQQPTPPTYLAPLHLCYLPLTLEELFHVSATSILKWI